MISLRESHSMSTSKNVASEEVEIIILSSDEDEVIPRPITPAVRLRPIIIHGCNVAREHGKHRNTYSCKGIRISVEYFLRRGHTEVSAIIPMYRLHHKSGAVLTTDHDALNDLYEKKQVIFYPSKANDNRFIIQSAVSNGGIVLSNNNFVDLLDESWEYREIIKKRLLKYVFVRDFLMVPNDPLGREGPSLSEFLAFPAA